MSKTVPHPLFLHTSRLTKRTLHMTGVLDSFPESHAIWYMSTNNYTSANSPQWLHTIWRISVILVLLASQRRRGVGVGAVSETLAGWHFDFIRSRAEARSHLMPGAVSNGRPPWPRTLNDKIDEKHCRCCRGCSFTSCYQHCRWSSDHNWHSLESPTPRFAQGLFKPYSHIYQMCFGSKAVQAVLAV